MSICHLFVITKFANCEPNANPSLPIIWMTVFFLSVYPRCKFIQLFYGLYFFRRLVQVCVCVPMKQVYLIQRTRCTLRVAVDLRSVRCAWQQKDDFMVGIRQWHSRWAIHSIKYSLFVDWNRIMLYDNLAIVSIQSSRHNGRHGNR